MQSPRADIHSIFCFSASFNVQDAATDIVHHLTHQYFYENICNNLLQHVRVRGISDSIKELPQTRSWCNSYVAEELGIPHSSMIAYVSALSPRRAEGPAFLDDCVCKRPITGRARGHRFPDDQTYTSRHACLLLPHHNKMLFMTAPITAQSPTLIHRTFSGC